jgi:hypothetical protein
LKYEGVNMSKRSKPEKWVLDGASETAKKAFNTINEAFASLNEGDVTKDQNKNVYRNPTHRYCDRCYLFNEVKALAEACDSLLTHGDNVSADNDINHPQEILDALAKVMEQVKSLKQHELLVIKLQQLSTVMKSSGEDTDAVPALQNDLEILAGKTGVTLEGTLWSQQRTTNDIKYNDDNLDGNANQSQIEEINTQIESLTKTILRINNQDLPTALQHLDDVSSNNTRHKVSTLSMLVGAVIGAVVGVYTGLMLSGPGGALCGGIIGFMGGTVVAAAVAEAGWKLGECAERYGFFGVQKGTFSLAKPVDEVGYAVRRCLPRQ